MILYFHFISIFSGLRGEEWGFTFFDNPGVVQNGYMFADNDLHLVSDMCLQFMHAICLLCLNIFFLQFLHSVII